MRVFRRGLILAALLCASAPSVAGAAPILAGSTTCGDLVATTECSLLGIDPLSAELLQLSGDFVSSSDIALFSFTFDEGTQTRLTVTTTSFASGSFDPTLALFNADGSIYEYLGSDGVLTQARFFDISLDSFNYDDYLDLVLGGGSYFLALIAYPNEFAGSDQSLGPLTCDSGCEPLGATFFAFDLSAEEVEGPPQGVPEPGTLTLLAMGALGALVRGRSNKRIW